MSLLVTNHLMTSHLCTLGRSIIEGDAKWDDDHRFTREFRYTKGYWEWTEDVLSRCRDRLSHIKIYDVVYALLFTYDHNSDIVKAFCEAWCPLTNTLLISAGEMSISLWDLRELAGLPMTGCLYDEVVPSALELTDIDEKRERFIPRSNKYLFYAYHLFQSADDNRCSHVSIDKWVKFWFKKTTKYHPPPPRKEKKMVWPKSTHNPLGDIAIHERPKSIKITLKRKKDEDKQVDGGENDPPHALIPYVVIECDFQAAVAEASKGKCSSHNIPGSDSSNKDRH
ncbi:hypothetical protein Sango_3110600 [Sesamum angolense]|uniref:Aminotransferase-like plant mobile domain-containing protein n=1 Tax=Sesamum angolense TaxID=2727404 RepID=A0AAE1T8J2_9LAMI|nr:hypothetical protein Sango_3110600 [Sesamum angolense]